MILYPISHQELLRRTDGRGVCIELKMRFNGERWEAWIPNEGRRQVVRSCNPWEAIAKLGSYVIRFRLVKNPGLRKLATRRNIGFPTAAPKVESSVKLEIDE